MQHVQQHQPRKLIKIRIYHFNKRILRMYSEVKPSDPGLLFYFIGFIFLQWLVDLRCSDFRLHLISAY